MKDGERPRGRDVHVYVELELTDTLGLELHVQWVLEVLELLDAVDRRERVLVIAVVRPDRLQLVDAQRSVIEPDPPALEVRNA